MCFYHGEKTLTVDVPFSVGGPRHCSEECLVSEHAHMRIIHVQNMTLILSFCHSKWQFHHLYQRQTHLISCCSMSKRNSLKRFLFSLFVCQCCRLRFCLCFTCLSVSSCSQRMFCYKRQSALPFHCSSLLAAQTDTGGGTCCFVCLRVF